EALQVLRPLGEPLLDPLLHLVQPDRVLGGRAALLLLELLAALLGEPAGLLREDAAELRADDGERALQLCRSLLVFLLDQRGEPGALLVERPLGLLALPPHSGHRT